MDSAWMEAIRRIYTEREKGGDQPPCPFCKLPRVTRSDHIRCCRCGINWLQGEPLDRDPREHRRKLFLTSIAETARPGKKEAEHENS